MKPRHFWAIYAEKTRGKKKGRQPLTKKDAKRLRLLLERERAKDASGP